MKILNLINEQINQAQTQIAQLVKIHSFLSLKSVELLDSLPDACIYTDMLDFNNLSHDKVMQVIKVFPGHWKKEPTMDARINYSTEVNGIKIRCWSGEPPPNCKIVEELVTIPASPSRIVTRRKLVCV